MPSVAHAATQKRYHLCGKKCVVRESFDRARVCMQQVGDYVRIGRRTVPYTENQRRTSPIVTIPTITPTPISAR
ncbi:hypothetical protein BLA13014_01625 [Burkholderia aenigmatica]|uniref:Uncharacterized protein n=1 Tax=Burkholderia aenigmatica TaxID=2015348 RepID=A0A6P2JA89_9BURK|nr:hypothetical protein BLA13014_01625 [Burkholderia aenigmatica]